MKTYKGQDLRDVKVTFKIDGVQLVVSNGIYLSRAGKALYNIPEGLKDGTYEIFLGDWSKSVSACRTHNGKTISMDDIYMLTPYLDCRLSYIGYIHHITKILVDSMLADALSLGFEGLVLYTDTETFKVKPVLDFDVEIINIIEGTGRNKGKLGAFITSMGKVGIGFSDSQRNEFFNKNIIGKLIEVQCMSITKANRFRHPRFIRIREDKL